MNAVLKEISDKKGTEIRKSRKDTASKKEAKARRHLIRGLMMGVVGMVCADALKLFRDMCQMQLAQFTLDELCDDKYRTGCSNYTNLKDGVGIVGTVFDIKTRNPIAGVRFPVVDYSVSRLNTIVQTLGITDGIVNAADISSEPFKTEMVIGGIKLPVTMSTPLLPALEEKGALEDVTLDSLPDNETLKELQLLIRRGSTGMSVCGVGIDMYNVIPWLYNNVGRLVQDIPEKDIINIKNIAGSMAVAVRDENDKWRNSDRILQTIDILTNAKTNCGVVETPSYIIEKGKIEDMVGDIGYIIVSTDVGLCMVMYNRSFPMSHDKWTCHFVYRIPGAYVMCVSVNGVTYLYTETKNDVRVLSPEMTKTVCDWFIAGEFENITIVFHYMQYSEELAMQMVSIPQAKCGDGMSGCYIPLEKDVLVPKIKYHNVIANVLAYTITDWGYLTVYFHDGKGYNARHTSMCGTELPIGYIEDALIKMHPLVHTLKIDMSNDMWLKFDLSSFSTEQLKKVMNHWERKTEQTWLISDTCAIHVSDIHIGVEGVYSRWQPEFTGCHTIIHLCHIEGVGSWCAELIPINTDIEHEYIPINACDTGIKHGYNYEVALIPETGEVLFFVDKYGYVTDSVPHLKVVKPMGNGVYQTPDKRVFVMHYWKTIEGYTPPTYEMYDEESGDIVSKPAYQTTIAVLGVTITLYFKSIDRGRLYGILGFKADKTPNITKTRHVVAYDFGNFRMVTKNGWFYISTNVESCDDDEYGMEFELFHTYSEIVEKLKKFNHWNNV